MIVLWILVLIACANDVQCLNSLPLPDLPPGEAPEPILTFMETAYRTGTTRTTLNAGSPLILTPYIEEKKFEEARKAAFVDPTYLLPDMESYAGYLTKSSTYSWGKNHSLLFIDNPVGTGFSFTDDDRGYAKNQTTIGENLYTALQQFLTLFPELRKAPLTLAGESYAGKHIPSLGVQILWNKHTDEPINLQGLAIGNGFIDPQSLQRYSYFVREAGLVDDNVADSMNSLETAVTQFINEGEMVKAYAYYNYMLQLFLSNSHLSNLYNYLRDDIGTDGPYINYIQTNEARKALHVGNTNFTSLGVIYRKLVPDFMRSSKMWLEELLENYKVMLYNGHLDIIVAYHPSVNTYKSLSFTGTSDFKSTKRSPWYHNGELVGYYKVASNLTEVMIRGAGHMVPADKPAASLGLISAFARGISLNEDTGSLVDVEKNSVRRRPLPQK